MGFSYRKSFKAGPFRVTASKSGISYSAGVKGARVTKRADGRVQTTLSAPGTGLRHTKTSGSKSAAAATEAARQQRLAKAELDQALREFRDAVLNALREGMTGDELRAYVADRDGTRPEFAKAMVEAEKLYAGEVREARRNGLAQLAAERLAAGAKSTDVDRWLKTEQGVGFWERGDIMSRAKKVKKRGV